MLIVIFSYSRVDDDVRAVGRSVSSQRISRSLHSQPVVVGLRLSVVLCLELADVPLRRRPVRRGRGGGGGGLRDSGDPEHHGDSGDTVHVL